jgi:site-specific recombinase XerD
MLPYTESASATTAKNRSMDQCICTQQNDKSGNICVRKNLSNIKNGELLGLTINTHSMRKSRGMAMYQDGVPVEKIAKVLNHSNTTSTLRYLGITQEEVLKTYDDYEL